MKRVKTSILGVTLLEIMLVLAIASMVIVMSMKYYQSASLSQKLNATSAALAAIAAAGETVYAAKGNLTTAATDIPTYLPNGVVPNSPFGGAAMTLANVSASSFSVTVTSISASQCAQLTNALSQNSKFAVACPTGVVTISE